MSTSKLNSDIETTMAEEAAYELAWTRLQHVLIFFDRVDTKLSVVLGINVATIGVVATQVADVRDVPVFGWLLVGAFLSLNGFSFIFLYRGSFPQLNGGRGSLIYFAQIAKLTREQFAILFLQEDLRARLMDVLEQVRSNACIANAKYGSLCWAYRLMALSLIPWIAVLTMFAILDK